MSRALALVDAVTLMSLAPSTPSLSVTLPSFSLSTMSTSQPSRNQSSGPSSDEPKARGANRSTKVAGKLKVLPEQPEPVPKDRVEQQPEGPPKRDEGEATGEDSEDDAADNEGDTEDVEVGVLSSLGRDSRNIPTGIQPN